MRVRCFGAGPTLVSVPGLAGGSGLFDGIHRGLAAAGYRVLAVDLAGDRWDLWAARLSFEEYAAELERLWRREIGEPAVLMGTSFGTLVALETLTLQPDYWRSLVLVAPPLPPPLRFLGDGVRCWIRRRGGHRAVCAASSLVFLSLVAWEGLNPVTLWRARTQLAAIAEARTPAKTIDEKLRLLYDVWNPKRLPHSDQPTLLVRGALDLISRPAAERLLASQLTGLETRQIAWTGHALHVARPAALVRVVLDFLQRSVRCPQ
jgi:pimeloyl-ACP methyl ester carboxylesterase